MSTPGVLRGRGWEALEWAWSALEALGVVVTAAKCEAFSVGYLSLLEIIPVLLHPVQLSD